MEYNGSFEGKRRDELLNGAIFYTLKEVKIPGGRTTTRYCHIVFLGIGDAASEGNGSRPGQERLNANSRTGRLGGARFRPLNI
jgi:hypothetical protein